MALTTALNRATGFLTGSHCSEFLRTINCRHGVSNENWTLPILGRRHVCELSLSPSLKRLLNRQEHTLLLCGLWRRLEPMCKKKVNPSLKTVLGVRQRFHISIRRSLRRQLWCTERYTPIRLSWLKETEQNRRRAVFERRQNENCTFPPH